MVETTLDKKNVSYFNLDPYDLYPFKLLIYDDSRTAKISKPVNQPVNCQFLIF